MNIYKFFASIFLEKIGLWDMTLIACAIWLVCYYLTVTD